MLVWINGPFGGGKTQTAHEVQRRLPRSVICDPEHVTRPDGVVIARMTIGMRAWTGIKHIRFD
jgi:adenylylsulfate kinase-like enzyme